MMARITTLGLLVITMFMVTPAGRSDFFGCHDMIVPGAKKFEIDKMYLYKTRMLNGLAENSAIQMSHFIHSNISKMDFVHDVLSEDKFIVNININEDTVANNVVVDGWVSDRTRDGVCALELEGWKGTNYVNEYMQILAIYPGGTLALGLPNTQNRIGLIFLINEGGYNPLRLSRAASDLFSL